MAFLRVAICCALVAFASSLTAWEDFKQTYNRQYKDAAEEAHRQSCFYQTVERIKGWNDRDHSAQYGINQFADLCAEEFKKFYHNAVFSNKTDLPPAAPLTKEDRMKASANESWDWRQHGAVTHVKNQGQCGSCWTFSAVGAMEGAWFLAGHSLTSLSEEQLVQCALLAGQGCNGGNMRPAINYVVNHGGINSELGYPYTSGGGVTGICNPVLAAVKVAHMKAALAVPPIEAELAVYLQKYGPLAVGVDANDGWQSYLGGIKSICLGVEIDHGVTLVGFAPNYWIVKNSWGLTWGELGYIRLRRGLDCDGIALSASAAVGAQ